MEKMFTSVTNILENTHNTTMKSVNNIA
jgi:hypothetical protein